MIAKLLIIAVLLVIGFVVPAKAQSQYAGRYDLVSGYTSGSNNGLFGYGIATASSTGAIAYSAYFPRLRGSGRGSGRIYASGAFTLHNRTSGLVQMHGARVAVGTFRDPYGSGYFAVRKK